MDLNNQDSGENAQKAVSVNSLISEHRMLDERVTELSRRSFLSSEEKLELARLKKEKLRMKDKISEISEHSKSA